MIMSTSKVTLILFVLFALINLVFLDIFVFKLYTKNNQIPVMVENQTQKSANSCPGDCIERFEALIPTVEERESSVSSVSSVTPASGVNEYFIPLGSGVTSSGDWEDLSGIQGYVDTNNYGKMKKVVFEISLRVPTGNQTVWARLYNKTDNHPVWYSEVSMDGGTPVLLTSKPIELDSGNKLYVVQVKTQLKYNAYVDQARIHINTL